MDTIRRILKSSKQAENPSMRIRVVTVEKMLADYDERGAMLTAFKHAANSIGKAAGITKDHVGHGEIAESVCGDVFYLELISEAEERFKRQAVENDEFKAQVERLRDGLNTAIEAMVSELNERGHITDGEVHDLRTMELETPAASLIEIQQRAIFEAADHLRSVMAAHPYCDHVQVVRAYVDRIRNESDRRH
jgi:hypothetical protein